MKKLMYLLFFAAAISFAACTGEKQEDENSEQTTEESTSDKLDELEAKAEEENESLSGNCDDYIEEYAAWVEKYVETTKKFKENPTDASLIEAFQKLSDEAKQWAVKVQDCLTDKDFKVKYDELSKKVEEAANSI